MTEKRIAAPSPESIDELLRRSRAFAGLQIGEIATRMKRSVPDTSRHKGFVGQLIEDILGASAGSRDEPDFPHLGVELKTIPLGANGKPSESTFVATIALSDFADQEWEESLVAAKLRRVLFVPVQGSYVGPAQIRMVGRAFLWIPDASEWDTLRRDWEQIAALVERGESDTITARLGTVLQVRPKGANNREMARAPSGDGGTVILGRKGFYLRPAFTHQVLGRHF